jgi:predicted dinucleotide-binding enzyme
MRIGVIGAGWLGGTVGGVWAKAGHEVLFSSRHPDKLASMLVELGPRASAGTPAEAAAFGEVVLIATPFGELETIGRELGGALKGKIVLDACNPYPPDREAFRREIETAGVAVSTAKYLPGARLVRAFSAVDATSVEASVAGRGARLGVPLASDDEEALRIAERLVRDAGCEPVVVGDLAAARSFQRGGPGFRANTSAPALRRRLGLQAVSNS